MKILIGYASGYGSTKSYAEVVGEELRGAGHEVDVVDAREAKELEGYDHVIVGGSLRAGNWLGHARKLAKRALNAGKANSVFICCMTATSDEGRRQLDEQTLPKLRSKLPELTWDEAGLFPGMRNMDQYGFPIRGIMKKMAEKAGDENPEEPKDYRDFEMARRWARELAGKLA